MSETSNLQGRKRKATSTAELQKKKKKIKIQSTIQAKDSKQRLSTYSLEHRLKTQKQSTNSLNTGLRLRKTTKDYKRLETLPVYRLYQKTPQHSTEIMANYNSLVPVMDWTEDAELQKRYIEWKEEVELELGSSQSNRANSEV